MLRPSSPLIAHIYKMAGVYQEDATGDPELLRRYADAQDENAFSVLMIRHGGMVWNISRRILCNTEDVEEAFQTTFLTLARRAKKIRVNETLIGWLQQVAYRAALAVRKKAKSQRNLQHALKEHARSERSPGPAQDEQYEDLHAEIAKLPETLRVALLLHYMEGKTQAAVAEVLGITEAAVWERLSRAKNLLHDRLAQRGLALGAVAVGSLLETANSRAAVSMRLLQKTVKAAADSYGGGKAGALGELVKEVLKHAPAARPWWKTGWMITVLCATGVGMGAGGVAWRAGFWTTQVDRPPVNVNLNAAEQSKRSKPTSPRLDAYGDPLPKHALARMGTMRFSQPRSTFHPALLYTPDGKKLISQSGGWERTIYVWDAASGKKLVELTSQCNAVDVGIAVSPDSRMLASESDDGTVRTWDLTTGKLIREYKAKNSDGRPKSNSLHICADGRILAVDSKSVTFLKPDGKSSVSYDGRLDEIRDVTTGRVISLKGEKKEGGIGTVAFSPDGKLLAIAWHLADVKGECGSQFSGGRGDVEIRLWNVVTGDEALRIRIKAERDKAAPANDVQSYSHTQILSMVFSPDGKTLALSEVTKAPGVTEFKGSVHLWDVATGRKINQLNAGDRCGGSEYTALAFSPDGKRLVGGVEGFRWDLTTGKRSRAYGWEDLANVACSPNGKILAQLDRNGVIRLWDALTGKELGPRPGLRSGIRAMAYSSDGKTLVTESKGPERMLRWWDVDTGRELRCKQLPESFLPGHDHCSTIFSSDAKMRLIVESPQIDPKSPKKIVCHKLKSDDKLRVFGPYKGVLACAFSHDFKKLANWVWNDPEPFRVWDLATGEIIHQFPISRDVLSAIAGWGNRGDIEGPGGLAFTPDDRILALPGEAATVTLLEMATGQAAASLKLHDFWEEPWRNASGQRAPKPKAVAPILFSPDGKLLLTSTYGHDNGETWELWDLVAERKILDMSRGEGLARRPSFAFSPDARILAVGGMSGSGSAVDLIDVATAKEAASLVGHEAPIHHVAFSQDGRTLASCSEDATCLIWDMTTFRRPRAERAGSEPQKKLSQETLETAWRELDADAAKAYHAMKELASAPQQAVALLQARLSTPVDLSQLEKWIADLDSERFAVRRKAGQRIQALREEAVPRLRQALKGSLSVEARKRAQVLLAQIEKTSVRKLRSVKVLELIGSPEAREALAALARGPAEAPVAQEAQTALARLAKRIPDPR